MAKFIAEARSHLFQFFSRFLSPFLVRLRPNGDTATCFLLLILSLCLLSGSVFVSIQPALASVHRYQERPGQVTYRSQQSLRDRDDRAWQAVLFKRQQDGQWQGTYLRLVGFPGAVDVVPDQPLQVTTSTDQIWTAPSARNTPLPSNVGQYDIRFLMAQLQSNAPLELAVPLTTGETANVVVPPFVLQEWRDVANRAA
jgi:hypothetical protein